MINTKEDYKDNSVQQYNPDIKSY